MSFIIDSHKATILLPLMAPVIPQAILSHAHEQGLLMKHETHLTILSFQNGKKVLQSGIDFARVIALAESLSWGIVHLPEYALLERTIPEFVLNGKIETPRHTRKSIIQKLEVPDMDVFFSGLSRMSGVTFLIPPSHVTVFTWSDYGPEATKGIALNSQADYDSYVQGTFS